MTVAEPSDTMTEMELRGDYAGLIGAVRQRLAAERTGALLDPWIKEWAGRRYQSLFLDACLAQPEARAHVVQAGEEVTESELRMKLAERFVHEPAEDAVAGRQPPAAAAHIANTTFVFCPGLLNGLLPVTGFGRAFQLLEETYGMRVLAADAHPLRGCQANVADLLATIEHGLGFDAAGEPIAPEDAVPPQDFILLGYSKGLPDALHLLRNRPDLAKRVRAVVSWAGGSGGSHLADMAIDNVRKNRNVEPEKQEALIRAAAQPMMPGVVLQNLDRRKDEYDVRAAFEQLGTTFRRLFWEDNLAQFESLDIPWFYVVALARLIDLPYFHVPLSFGVALHDRFNDMQLTRTQATIPLPSAVHLASFHASHWDIAYPSFPEDMRMGSKKLEHHFPREAGLSALVLLLAELGVID